MAKKRKASEPTESKTYEVVNPVDHDNERYEPGESIELDGDQAASLLKCGAVKEAA